MKVETFETPQDAAKALAGEVAELIRTRAAEGKNVVLGLATGATPLPFYAELVRMHKEEGLSFANVISFNLDEYSGLDRDHPESYWYFMHTNLFNHIDIKPENINLPSGTVKDDEIAAHCAAYEQKIKDCGGIDLQILGIGRTGHIGFNEPGSDDTTITRQVHLDELTRSDAAPAFGGIENVPTTAITMGVATIMGAREVANVSASLNVPEEKSVLLQHLILSHHGEPEFGAAVKPMCAEGELLSFIDMIDSRMEIYREALEEVPAGEFSKRIFALDRRIYHHN